ncbi:MAG: hypothetical protein IKX67_04030 [Bacteroidales bacterium]|nr:hypothetical protein [Bacteroidales bacterium]
MKKILLVAIMALAACWAVRAQDIVVLKNGTEIKAKVTEVSSDAIKYKRADNPNGPIYVLQINEIASITYENGTVETFRLVREDNADKRFPQPPVTAERYPQPPYYAERNYEPRPDVRYADIKNLYNPYYYVSRSSDPYQPWVGGMCSFLVPGLGQALADEWGRGLGFFGANLGFLVAECIEMSAFGYGLSGLSGLSDAYYYGESEKYIINGGGALLLTLAGHAIVNIWGICDAVRIAKVKNMYFQDADGLLGGVQVKLDPTLAMVPSAGTGNFTPTFGMSLKVNF